MDLEGKVVLITGAGVRLGAEMARALSARGARPAIHYRESEAAARALAEELGGACFRADLRDLAEVQELPGRILEEMGRLDALVNSAAVFGYEPFGEVGLAGWDLHMEVNLRAPFFLSQAFVAALGAEGEGRILNLMDCRGDVMDPAYPAYSLSKAGLTSLTKGLARALAPRVRVYGLALGPMMEAVTDGPAPPAGALIPGLAPGGTTGEAAAFLLGPGDYATGAILYLDGGQHLGGGDS
jgi:NAD(P)-dependent dehydrogenase (short-subunit alcohol dehydrogenase family)